MSKINFFYEDVEKQDILEIELVKRIKFLIKNEGKRNGELAIIFCSDNYLLNVNIEFLNHNYYTDIITFNYCENSIISGDLFISIERVKENASKFNTTFKHELYRVIFHGILHLIGYNDKTEDEKILMRSKEDFYLKGMDFDKEIV